MFRKKHGSSQKHSGLLDAVRLPASPAAPLEKEVEKKKRKRKRKKPEDLAYRKGEENKKRRKKDADDEKSVESIAAMRAAHEAKETSVMLYDHPLSSPQVKAFHQACAKLPHHHEIDKVIQRTLNGSPWVIATPGGTEHTRIAKLGYIIVFSKEAKGAAVPPSPVKHVDPDSAAFTSSPLQSVKDNDEKIKFHSLQITPELLAATQRENWRNDNRRVQSQRKTAVKEGVPEKEGSATQYANVFEELPKNQLWEWLHLIAHFILGKKSQDIKNMGVGTYHANTEMCFVESQFQLLAKAYPEGFRLEVKAHFIESTQLMHSIEYTITTKDFVLPIVFNAQRTSRPDITVMRYMRNLVETMIEGKKLENELKELGLFTTKKSLTYPDEVKVVDEKKQQKIGR